MLSKISDFYDEQVDVAISGLTSMIEPLIIAFLGIVVTAKGDEVDFVSRFFAPQSGINEDSVTGSAHVTLAPYWADRLGKTVLTAKQLSERR